MRSVLLIVFLFVYTNSTPVIKHRSTRNVDVLLMSTRIHCEIANRYARTTIKNVYFNNGDETDEVDFDVALPVTGFITDFIVEVDDKVYKSEITTKEKADEIYNSALDKNFIVGKVEHSKFRDSEGVSIPINLQPKKNVSVILKYEELVTYFFETYYWNFNIYMTDYAPEFSINVFIDELSEIKDVNAMTEYADDVATRYPIDKKYVKINKNNKMAHVNFEIPKHEVQNQKFIFYKPTGDKDINARFLLSYVLERKSAGGDVIIDENGFYTHMMPAPLIQPLAKHLVFALDTSYSMNYQKINQLKSAMGYMIDKLSPQDYFSIITYDTVVKVWNLNDQRPMLTTTRARGRTKSGITPDILNKLPKPYPATEQYKKNAKSLVFSLRASGATNIYDSLKLSYHLAKFSKQFKNHPESIVVYLTDGTATVGERNKKTIIKMTKDMNSEEKKINLYTIGFGRDAEVKFLKEIAKENFGHDKHIYEANDASKQMTNFYETLSTPIISNVQFNHPASYGDKSTNDRYSLLNRGQELTSAGQVKNPQNLIADDFKIQGNSFDGNKILSPAVHRVFRSVNDEQNIGGTERHWAFIKLKTLIENVQNETDPQIANIVKLSLKYRFVTPYTSMIVIVPPEDDEELDEFLRSVIKPFQINERNVPKRLRNRFNVDSPIKTLPWLGMVLDENDKMLVQNQTYEIGDDGSELQTKDVVECDVPKIGESGNCMLIRDCPGVHPKLLNFETYLDYFCPLENDKYAGVCCILENDDD